MRLTNDRGEPSQIAEGLKDKLPLDGLPEAQRDFEERRGRDEEVLCSAQLLEFKDLEGSRLLLVALSQAQKKVGFENGQLGFTSWRA